MFSSKSLFSRIPCPYQDDCKVPQCLFLHAPPSLEQVSASSGVDVATTSSIQSTASGTAQSPAVNTDSVPEVSDGPDVSEDGQPRKRQKLDSGKGKKVARSTAPPPSSVLPVAQVGKDVDSKAASTIAKPPPPSKPMLPPPAKKDVKSTGKAKIAAQSPKDFYAPVAKTTQEVPIVEDLYPRNITPAPARYDLRHRLVQAVHQQLVRLNNEVAKDTTAKDLVLSDQALITLALDVELAAATENPAVYSNVVKNKVLYYKKLSTSDWKDERKKDIESKAPQNNKTSKLSTSSTRSPKKTLSAAEPIVTGLPEEHELLLLHCLYVDYVKTPQDHHGFVLTPPTDEMIAQSLKGLEAAQNWECCDRCKTRYQVFPGRRESDGALSTGGPCTFHWAKAFSQDLGQGIRGRGDRKYLCCGEAVGISAGCVKNEHHVFRVKNAARLATVLQFLETPENPELEKKLGAMEVLRPVCVDGEMAFTVHGMELIRLTATSWPQGSELLDILVRPLGEVLDINTRFSGVSTKLLTDAKPWSEDDPGCGGDLRIVPGPVEARALLLKMLTPKTPIVGHGLENDFNALRLCHPTVIDTSMIWPAKSGLPYRQPLKVLMKNILNISIQQVLTEPTSGPANDATVGGEEEVMAANGGLGGHDSKEDANSAGTLVHHALREEWNKMRLQGWSWRDPETIGKSASITPSPQSSPSEYSPISSHSPKPSLTPFEKHFLPPPRTKHQTRSNTNPNSRGGFLDSPRRDPNIQRPIRNRQQGSTRAESNEERMNRERAERNRATKREKRKMDEEERIVELERSKPVKRAKDGRTIKAYNDLDMNYDGASDPHDESATDSPKETDI